MNWQDKKPSIRYSGTSLVYGAFLLLILPMDWLMAAAVAAVFHEICHSLAIRLTGNRVLEIHISHGGVILFTTPMTPAEELLCALAGPAGSLLLFFCYRWIPKIALCAGIQGIFNLIPLYPMDGGRVFRAIVYICFPDHAAAVCRWSEVFLIPGMLLTGIYFSVFYKLGMIPVFLCVIVLSRGLAEKFLANRGN